MKILCTNVMELTTQQSIVPAAAQNKYGEGIKKTAAQKRIASNVNETTTIE